MTDEELVEAFMALLRTARAYRNAARDFRNAARVSRKDATYQQTRSAKDAAENRYNEALTTLDFITTE